MFSTLWKAAFVEKLEEKIHLWHPFFFIYGFFQADLFGPWRGTFAPIAPPCLRTWTADDGVGRSNSVWEVVARFSLFYKQNGAFWVR